MCGPCKVRAGRHYPGSSSTRENQHDIKMCSDLWEKLFLVLQQSLEEESIEDSPGSWSLLSFLVTLLQRDLEIWWKHGRLSQGDNALFPVVYYLLGGGGGLPVTRGAKKTVLALYR